jgi:uroporphyrinogen-III synthase
VKFLLLRPRNKYLASTAKMNEAGIPTIGLALMDIVANQQVLHNMSTTLGLKPQNALAIFISTNAANLALQQIPNWPQNLQALAVGQSTAEILTAAGVHTKFPSPANTEGLLAMDELANVQGKTIYLFKGQGGREELALQLEARGADIISMELYTRKKLLLPEASEAWQKDHIQCIIATSGELVEAAFEQLDNDWLKSTPWIVASQRIADIVVRQGASQQFVSENASDKAIIESARKFFEC